jgi:hypothetical protein
MGRARGGYRDHISRIRAIDKWVKLKGTFSETTEIRGELGEAIGVILAILEPWTNGMD